MIRIGHGFDLHRLERRAENGIVLGGVQIPYSLSFVAHSDGDVVIHALIDALLGAAALGDIGQYFPDTDPKYKNSNSRDLLAVVMKLIKQQHYQVNNVDITIVAQQPKLSPHRLAMCEILSQDLGINLNQVNVKAKTNEHCDAIGRCEAIAVYAVVTLLEDKN